MAVLSAALLPGAAAHAGTAADAGESSGTVAVWGSSASCPADGRPTPLYSTGGLPTAPNGGVDVLMRYTGHITSYVTGDTGVLDLCFSLEGTQAGQGPWCQAFRGERGTGTLDFAAPGADHRLREVTLDPIVPMTYPLAYFTLRGSATHLASGEQRDFAGVLTLPLGGMPCASGPGAQSAQIPAWGLTSPA